MDVEFDPAKDAKNIVDHGLSLADFSGFEGDTNIAVDDRFDYGETVIRLADASAARAIARCLQLPRPASA